MKSLILYISLLILILAGASCSTKKNTAISRGYHNLTAHYNAYYNGNEAYKQAMKKVDNAIRDDFTRVIVVYPISDITAAKTAESDMAVSIEKGSKVIKLHSIKARPKRKSGNLSKKQKAFYNRTEFCNWVDDSYLLVGKAKFVKHDWYGAEEAFEYIIKEFSSEEIRFDALVWLSRTYIEMGKNNEAKTLLDRCDGDKEFPKRLRKDLLLSYADLYLRQQKFDDASSKLNTALDFTKRKKEKARYRFILAQLYQQNGRYMEASDLYSSVIKMNPPYEMAFNAQINRATCFDQGSGNADQIRRQLQKMLRDDKNIEYQDQIYYALGKLSQKENDETQALTYFRKSAEVSVSNTKQKAISFLSVADIYFSHKNYLPAQSYYDSALVLLDVSFPNYTTLQSRSKNLTDLAGGINIVLLEDSLQKIAGMDEKERMKVIDGIIQDVIAEEQKKQQEEQQQQMNSMLYQQNLNNQSNNNQNAGGKWYFYNPSTMSFGLSEFKKKWGNRVNEDDWRRKNKSVVLAISDGSETDVVDSIVNVVSDNKKREFYLQNLPLTDSLIAVSNTRIEDALFSVAEIYMNRFKDYNESIKTFEALETRFPNSKYCLQADYYMYKMYLELQNKEKAEFYKNRIITKYPESNYAHMLSNPNYLRELEEKKQLVSSLYSQTYQAYLNRDFVQVFRNCVLADSAYSGNHLEAKFGLLKAMTTARTGDLHGFKSSLTQIVNTYPGTEEKTTAENILAYVEKGDYSYLTLNQNYNQNQTPDTQAIANNTTNVIQETEDELYTVVDESQHQYIIIVDKNADVNKLKYYLFSFNIDHFSMFDFDVKVTHWDDRNQAIRVQFLSSKREALKYYKTIVRNQESVFRDIHEKQYQHFVISEQNLEKLSQSKDIQRYLNFFQKKYTVK